MFKSFIPAIIWWLVVLVLLCTPSYDLPDLGFWVTLLSFDKIIHIIIFGLMALFFMLPFALNNKTDKRPLKNLFIKIAVSTAIWGLTTELIQYFWIFGRSFDMLDFAADSIGAYIAYLISKKYLL